MMRIWRSRQGVTIRAVKEGGAMGNRILVVGTYDTKDDELTYLAGVIRGQGGEVLTMDVSVLGDPKRAVVFDKHVVVAAGGSTIANCIAAGDENIAMQAMARGAAALAAQMHRAGRFDGVIVLGGSMRGGRGNSDHWLRWIA
jgi:uncharacterized protein (UPF0261 family)